MAAKSIYIPELKLTIFSSSNENVSAIRKRYIAAAKAKKVTLGSNLRSGLKKFKIK